MRLLITGGFGYIGSVMAREAIKRGHEIMVYDSLVYEQNSKRILEETGIDEDSFFIGDTRNIDLISEAVRQYKPDYVFHFAELSSVYACNHHPEYTESINFAGTKNVLQVCEELKIPVIYNSTSSVYGTQKEMTLCTEETQLPEPTDYYTKNKLKVEEYIKSRPNLKCIVLRPATIFGLSPRFRIELLPNHFTYMALSRGRIPVSGLNAYRAAMDVDDLVEGYFKILEKGSWDSTIYNIGHFNMNKKEFAEGIQKVVPCEIGFAPDVGDLRNLQIDCSKFNKEFNFAPSISYEETIKKVADWLKENLTRIEANNFVELLNMPLGNWKNICS